MRRISHIPMEMNRTTGYMAQYGLERLNSFSLAPGNFGNLLTFLENDMGLGLPFRMEPNFGEGEVINASPPLSPIQVNNNEPLALAQGTVAIPRNLNNDQLPHPIPQVNVFLPFSMVNVQSITNVDVSMNFNQNVFVNIINNANDENNAPEIFERRNFKKKVSKGK